MQLDDCDLDGIGAVSMAPIRRSVPEQAWANAFESGAIPSGIYDLYRRANFLSFGMGPRFLSDEENLLFSYFGLALRSIQESLADAQEQAQLFAGAHELVYDPMKQARGERWEKDASKREVRHFRDLLIALQTSLDSLAEVIAIFFPGCINGLEVGRAQFSKVEQWVKRSFLATGPVVAPSEFYLKVLYDAVEPLINAPHPETDWLPLMRLLRNKAAHLGQPLFRQVGLPRAGDGRLFAFIPRQWPYLWESLIQPASERATNPIPFPELLNDSLIHQDIVSYSRGLVAKVRALVAAASIVLNETYDRFKDLPENQSALIQLKGNFQKYDFEYFVDVPE
jgi:hypothetical protein